MEIFERKYKSYNFQNDTNTQSQPSWINPKPDTIIHLGTYALQE